MRVSSRSILAMFLFVLLAISSLSTNTDAFTPGRGLSLATKKCSKMTISVLSFDTTEVATSSTCLMAAGGRKRRRRKNSLPSPPEGEELPDFDDEEEAKEERASPIMKSETPAEAENAPPAAKTPPKPTSLKRGSGLNSQLAEELGGNVDGLDEDLILSAMRGKTGANWQPPRSIQETINDRSLEKLMDFDKMIEQDGGVNEKLDLPTMDEVIARRKQREAADAAREGRVEDAAMLIDTEGMGKKAAKAAQRRATAIEREAAAEAEKSPFEGINILKLLENGAWVGIGLLVLWEVYINSPFFERAAPLIPVVYDDPVPPGM
mmetsp:Transcript_33448/g.64215  ORF Transcript_33448/g.64215 Transcript_33448/m.64215 type:complete len:321 (-) Transcript_33448:108-1070(-)